MNSEQATSDDRARLLGDVETGLQALQKLHIHKMALISTKIAQDTSLLSRINSESRESDTEDHDHEVDRIKALEASIDACFGEYERKNKSFLNMMDATARYTFAADERELTDSVHKSTLILSPVYRLVTNYSSVKNERSALRPRGNPIPSVQYYTSMPEPSMRKTSASTSAKVVSSIDVTTPSQSPIQSQPLQHDSVKASSKRKREEAERDAVNKPGTKMRFTSSEAAKPTLKKENVEPAIAPTNEEALSDADNPFADLYDDSTKSKDIAPLSSAPVILEAGGYDPFPDEVFSDDDEKIASPINVTSAIAPVPAPALNVAASLEHPSPSTQPASTFSLPGLGHLSPSTPPAHTGLLPGLGQLSPSAQQTPTGSVSGLDSGL